MVWDKSARDKIGPQSIHELHVQNVYNDPDFAKDVASITLTSDGTVTGTPKGEEFAQKYAINTEEIDWYLSPLYPTFEFLRDKDKSRSFQIVREENADKAYVTIRFRKTISKEDYMMSWYLVMSRFKQMPIYKSKNKLPDEHEVVYAIFKARQQKPRPSFSKIFQDYQNGELAGFNSHTNYFTSKDSMERYYNRYKPTQ